MGFLGFLGFRSGAVGGIKHLGFWLFTRRFLYCGRGFRPGGQKRAEFLIGKVDVFQFLFGFFLQSGIIANTIRVPDIDQILIGLPYVLDGSILRKFKGFKTSLYFHFDMFPIIFVDR